MRSIVIVLAVFIACQSVGAAELTHRISATAIVTTAEDPVDGNRYTGSTTRLRLDASYFTDDVEFKLILDDELFMGGAWLDSPGYRLRKEYRPDIPFDPYVDAGSGADYQNRLRLYRAYTAARMGDTRITAGLFRVGLGVGKLWAPVDVFNPRDPLAIEPEEREGVVGAGARHFIDGFTSIEAAAAMDGDDRLTKGLLRFRTFVNSIDLGFLVIRTDTLRMAGWELTGSLTDTGIELRSEGGWFIDDIRDTDYPRVMLGGEYGFASGVTLNAEFLHNGGADTDLPTGYSDPAGFSQSGENYIGASASYLLTPLITPAGSVIQNLDDGSRAITASIAVSVTDETDAEAGVQTSWGEQTDEYGGLEPLMYIRATHFF